MQATRLKRYKRHKNTFCSIEKTFLLIKKKEINKRPKDFEHKKYKKSAVTLKKTTCPAFIPFPWVPARLNLTSILLQEHINSDWVFVWSWLILFYIHAKLSVNCKSFVAWAFPWEPAIKVKSFFSSGTNCPLAHTARAQNIRVRVSVQNQSTEYMANWGTVKRHLYSVSKRWRANGSFHSETD